MALGKDVPTMIAARECAESCRGEPDLVERIRKAFRFFAKGHWILTDENEQLRAALSAVMTQRETTDAEKDRIVSSVDQLRAVGAMLAGVPVSLGEIARREDETPSIPLRQLWLEARAT